MQERPLYANDFLPPAAPPAPGPAVVAPALYQAALGPLNAAHYLAAFDRLDAAGRALPGWNWAAALCTPGWLVFHRLWRFALLYLAVLALAGLLLFGVCHVWLALPLPMTAGLLLALGLVACGVPGLYGDAFLHAQLQQRIHRALSAAPNLRQAKDLLAQQAGSPRRLMAVAAGGLGLALFAALAWAWLAGGLGRYVGSSLQAHQLAQRPPAAAVQRPAASAVPQSAPRHQLLPAPVSPAPDVSASSPLPSSALPQPQASVPMPAGDASGPSASAFGVAAQKAPAIAAAVPAAAPAAVVEKAPEKATPKTSDAPPAASAASNPARARAAGPAQNAAQSQGKSAPAQDSARHLYINVGLFANPANARRAHARLVQAGLPATVSQVARADGRQLQRVRVGPFASAAQANAAVEQVLALGLDARPAAE